MIKRITNPTEDQLFEQLKKQHDKAQKRIGELYSLNEALMKEIVDLSDSYIQMRSTLIKLEERRNEL